MATCGLCVWSGKTPKKSISDKQVARYYVPCDVITATTTPLHNESPPPPLLVLRIKLILAKQV